MGWRGRGGGWGGRWPGRGPFSYLPLWQRPGWLYGYGRGLGFGRGPSNPWVCQRFPWLPRWWWAAQTPEAALEMLESYLERLGSDREPLRQGIEARIDELKKLIKEGTPTTAAPPVGPTPFWNLAPYMPTPEQEKKMLEQQAEALERQIETIRKRLEELRG